MIHSNVKNAQVLSNDDLEQISGGLPNNTVNIIGRGMEVTGGAAVAVGTWVAATSVGEDATGILLPVGISQGAAGGALAAAGGIVAYIGNILSNAPSGPLLEDLPRGEVTVEPGWDIA